MSPCTNFFFRWSLRGGHRRDRDRRPRGDPPHRGRRVLRREEQPAEEGEAGSVFTVSKCTHPTFWKLTA